jgi:cytoskeletal protein CcmA (bactofilin family)
MLMWKKDEMPMPGAAPEMDRTPRPERERERERSPSLSASGVPGERATIGRSITIRGDVTGDEDLLIQGRVDGSVDLKQHSVTVGSDGEVKASIVARVVIVEGSVEGNIRSEEQVVLRSSARVQGDITAPRLVLEDGARFRGGVDMGEVPDASRSAVGSSQQQSKRPTTNTPAPTPSASDTPSEPVKATAETGGGKGRGADAVVEARS